LDRVKDEAMKWLCIMSGVLAMAALVMPAQAACPVPPGAIQVALPSGLPPALRHALPGDIALPGEPFDSTDVYVKGHKHRRYIFVWNIGNRWMVATEQGGIALRAEIFTYDLGKDGEIRRPDRKQHYISAQRVRSRDQAGRAVKSDCPRSH
jgi:hypothetical protein